MNTIRLKLDKKLIEILSKNGYKVEWAEFEETDETEDMFQFICNDIGEIWEEYISTQATFEELKKRGIYDYFPTFEWQVNEDYWYKSNIYEVVENKNNNN